mgnify:CR=1 FL=1|tara:strand:+ start:13930 stop:15990 length:2061 start_codon:yes stop_codon:yes gene_type:complete
MISVPFSSLILIATISFFLSFFLYFFKEKKYNDISFNSKLFLFLFRFISFFLILLFTLNPYIESKVQITEKPTLVIFQDNSMSISSNKDSLFYKNDYIELIESFKSKIENKYNVEFLLFGDKIRRDSISFTDKFSDIGSIFDYSEDVFSNINIGSYILLSDGIYNRGQNPEYSGKILNAPLHIVALGDTNKVKDVLIHSVNNNNIGFPGNELPVEINLKAYNLKDEKVNLTVKAKNSIVFQKVIEIEEEDFIKSVFFYVKSFKPGLNKFDISISPNSFRSENNTDNNYSSFYIDIVDNEKNILMLYDFPHPDISALKSAIQLDKQYNISVHRIADFKKNIYDFDLVILYQCDLNYDIISKLNKKNIPIWYIIGSESNLSKLNELQKTIYFKDSSNEFKDIYVNYDDSFQKFKLDDNVIEMINNSPPLLSTEIFEIKSDIKVLISKKNQNNERINPILFFSKNNQDCFFISEGIWRWKLSNFLKNSNHENFNSIIIQIVKNLLVNKNKERLKFNNKTSYEFGESIIINAQFYNENLEFISNNEIEFVLKDDDGNKFNYSFLTLGENYYLNLGELNPGNYNFAISTQYDNRNFIKKGSFVVENSFIENKITLANHELLYNIALQNNGLFFQLSDLKNIENELLESGYLKPIIHNENERSPLINSIIPLILILFFLFSEWFFRKRFIGY